MEIFTKNIEELFYLTKYKCRLTAFLKKNFKENVHYITNKILKKNGHGGHNKINYMLTEETFKLIKNSYNLRNKYIVDNTIINVSNPILMCIENQTIGFIENSYKNIISCIRQYRIGIYKVDLYFENYNLVIECDENNHNDRNPEKEKQREEYIKSQGKHIIRYNPNEENFDLSNVLNKINLYIMKIK